MFATKLSIKNHPFFNDLYDEKPHSLYLKLERKLYDTGIFNRGFLDNHLKSLRIKHKMTITHLAMILNCSRPQYLRMERGENRFKDNQIELLAVLYGEEMSTYKDMQDLDYLLKKIGYNDNPERAIHLLNLALRAVTIPSYDDNPKANLTFEIAEKTFSLEPISKEIQQQKLTEIIENLNRRFKQNNLKMADVREKIVPMADTPNPTKAKLWQQIHLLEDEQSSIIKLIDKLRSLH